MLQNRVSDLIKPFRDLETVLWQVRIEASRALLDIEFYRKGLDEALSLFMIFVEEETSLRGLSLLASLSSLLPRLLEVFKHLFR